MLKTFVLARLIASMKKLLWYLLIICLSIHRIVTGIADKRAWRYDFEYHKQSGRSPKVVALFSATNFSSYIIELL